MSEFDKLDAIDDIETAKQTLLLYAKENARLHRRLAELVAQLAELRGTPKERQLELELNRLQEQLGGLQRKVFGDSSERRPKDGGDKASSKTKDKQRGHGAKPQLGLPKVEHHVRLEESQQVCTECGEHYREREGKTRETEIIDMFHAAYRRLIVVQHEYECSCARVRAPAIPQHIEGGRYSLQFAVGVAISKYADHLPLTRQCKMMKRSGLDVDSQTLWDQLDALAKHLVPAYEKLRAYILGADVVGADETWWRMMGAKLGSKSTKRWWAWSLTTPDAVWHGIAPSRSAEAAESFIGDYEGTLLVDGYKAYDTLAKRNRTLRLAHCWAHARRKFVEAEPSHPECGEALNLIGQLFELDGRTENPGLLSGDAKANAERARLELRNTESRPVLERLRAWALEQTGLPKSGLRKAIDYMFRYWDGLTVFLEDPHVPLDNNATERALRGLVIGRKNHYGSRSVRGTEVAALFYSLIDTAQMVGVNPADYLYTATILAIEHGEAVLPWDLAKLSKAP